MLSARNATELGGAPGSNRVNNFDFLRIVGALLVIIGHSFTLTGAGPAPRLGGMPIHSIGVGLFFAISGYLVRSSWRTHPVLLRFAKHRVARLAPALVVVVVLSTFLIGPLASRLPVGRYLQDPDTYEYLLSALLLAQYDLPGVFDSSAHRSQAVNGSLWTLGVEAICYVSVVLVGSVVRPQWNRRTFAVIAGALMVCCTVLGSTDDPSLAAAASITEVMSYFAVGAALSGLPAAAFRLVPAVSLTAAWIVIAAVSPGSAQFMAWVAVPYVVVTVGMRSWPYVARAGMLGDPSYGLYLWGFLIQQLVIEVGPVLDPARNIASVVALSAGAAYLSWHLVEKPVLRVKDARWMPTRARAASA